MSEIRATTISDSAGTGPITLTGQSAAKAWVNFNGNGTVSIEQSENISSLSDDGTGQYTVTFTNNLNYTRHASVASCGDDTSSYDSVVSLDPVPSASEQFVLCWDVTNGVLEDQKVVSIITHGDLA